MSEEVKHRRGGRRPGRKPAKVDAKTRLERSRQSARECRQRKKLRYQYLEELVSNKEQAVYALRDELEQSKQWCLQLDAAILPPDLLEFVKKEETEKELKEQTSTKNRELIHQHEDMQDTETSASPSDSDSSKDGRHFKKPQTLFIEGRRRSENGEFGKQENGSPVAGPSGLYASYSRTKDRDSNRLSRSDSDGSAVGIENIDFLDMISDDDGACNNLVTVEDLQNVVFSSGSHNKPSYADSDVEKLNSIPEASSQLHSKRDGRTEIDSQVSFPSRLSEPLSGTETETLLSLPVVTTSPNASNNTAVTLAATSDHIYAFTGNLPSIINYLQDS